MPVRPHFLAVVVVAGALLCGNLFAQDDEDAQPPGLLAAYSVASRTIERIDPDIAFVWGKNSPDSRLPEFPLNVVWRGRLLVQTETKFTFHAFVEGEVSLSLNGKRVVEGKTNQPGWISGEPIALDFGEKELEARYRKTGENARVQLFWSSDRFPIEPLPAHLLFHENPHASLTLYEKGRREFEAHRCGRCHQTIADTADMPAPALTSVASSLSRESLIAKIRNPDSGMANARMPDFGFSQHEAEAIAAFLLDGSTEVKLEPLPANLNLTNERHNGEELARTIGCLACHQIGSHGNNGPYGGGDLSNVGARRSSAWLYNWLKHPDRLNTDHRMPVFDLSQKELNQLTAYLSGLRRRGDNRDWGDAAKSHAVDSALIAAGRKLVAEARCVACHRVPDDVGKPIAPPKELLGSADWSRACSENPPMRQRMQPGYLDVDRKAVQQYINEHGGESWVESSFTIGARLFERRNCSACHRRDGGGGLEATAGAVVRSDMSLQGQSETLVPPALNAVGDKLTDAALAKAVRGEQKPRMNWLRVQMPKFQHSAEHQQALTDYLIGHDRIPESALNSQSPVLAKENETQFLIAGHSIVGAQGWNCLACHSAGRFVPKNAAPATRGSDLLTFGSRMRPEFFLRWMRAPLRITPGIEMPGYERPVPGVLDGNIDQQFAALWRALNDPRFTVPTNPTAVEQFLVVRNGQPARIVHDVFTNPKGTGGGNIPRALAIGLNNGHNVLYDLSTFTVRQWTVGDFARQRTEGKSWYWDMAGLPVVSGFPARCDIALVPRGSSNVEPILPVPSHGTCGRLLLYAQQGDGVYLSYELYFDLDDQKRNVHVEEIVDSTNRDRGGWNRRIHIAHIPAGFVPVLLKTDFTPLLGEPEIQTLGDRVESTPAFTWFRPDPSINSSESESAELRLQYLAPAPETPAPIDVPAPLPPTVEAVTAVPGFDGVRLPFVRSIMPTAITFTHDGRLAFSSLKGHVYTAFDTNNDGIEDRLTLFEEGLASAYGLIADGKDLIVAHKPELLRLSDTNGDGKADQRTVFASGWGMTDNYHDWTCGIVRDSSGYLYVGLGSDYTQKKRAKEESLWRGKVLRIDPSGRVEPVGHAFRYPTGLAIDQLNRVFVTDQQGEQNTFNEINFLMPGRHYGVAARHEEEPDAPETPPAIAVPHPWTRSVNGITFLPETPAWGPFAGHGIGCEYDSRFLIRFTVQTTGNVVQGAVYHFSRPEAGAGNDNFRGPLSVAATSDGRLYIGSIHDSGWLGGQNVGDIVQLRRNESLPNGIRELRATPDGFEIEFLSAVDPAAATLSKNYSISGYTRVWKGGYATPDSGRHRVAVKSVELSADAKTVRLATETLREQHVYEVTAGRIGADAAKALFPATGHYTMLRVPTVE